VMRVFGVQRGHVAAPARMLAAAYAHNQLFYDHSDLHGSQRKRWVQTQAAQSHMRKAASGIASVLKNAMLLRDEAVRFRESNHSAARWDAKDALAAWDLQGAQQGGKEQLRQLLSAYNAALQSLEEAKPYLKRSVRTQLTSAAAGYEVYGIRQLADGTLELDEKLIDERMVTHHEYLMKALAGSGGLAEKLTAQAELMEQEPASAMLRPGLNLQTPLSSYQYQMSRGKGFASGMLFDLVV